MSVLWQRETATVGDVVAALTQDRVVTYSYVTHEKVARAFVYRPAVDERQARQRALKHLVARLFNGSPSLLVLNVLEDEAIDRTELRRLKKLIRDA